MKTIGFICEGESDKLLFESEGLKNLLTRFNLQTVLVIDASGNGNFLPKHMSNHLQQMRDLQADFIIVVTDLDDDACITHTKARINPENYLSDTMYISISVKAMEAWFLADSKTLTSIFKQKYFYEFPEVTPDNPFDTLKDEFITYTNRGVGNSKVLLTKRMLKNGFSIANAAQHPNCPSAKYFLRQLEAISRL